MLSKLLPRPLLGVLTVLAMFVALIATTTPMYPAMLLRLLPVPAWQRASARWCVWWARRWAGSNRAIFRALHGVPTRLGHGGLPQAGLSARQSYLLVCNHQSWADILILFDAFHGKTPFLRFFLKRDLLYVPIIGAVCWAMDFPFMTRKSNQADLAATRRACAVYRFDPVTVVNFLEGTRFSPAKRDARRNPYRHLLPPKSGGLAFTLKAMGEQFTEVLDVTIVYQPTRRKLLWSWLCGEQAEVRVQMQSVPVPATADTATEHEHRRQVQDWANGLWRDKDAQLQQLKSQGLGQA